MSSVKDFEEYNLSSKQIYLVNQLVKEFSSSLDFETVVKRVLLRIKEILNCKASFLLIFDELSDSLQYFGVSNSQKEMFKNLNLDYGKGIAWWSFMNNESIIANDAEKDQRFTKEVNSIIGFKVKNVICVPIVKENKKLGVIEGINSLTGSFSENDLEILKTISQFVAFALNNLMEHKRLEEKNIKLKNANEDLHNFIKIISHDLQTPLSSIKGYADLLKDELQNIRVSGSDIYEFLDRIQRNVSDIMNFVRDLLDFVEMKRKDLVVSSFNPLSALKEVVDISEKEKAGFPRILFEIEGVIQNIRFDRNLFFRLILLVIQNYSKIYRDLDSITVKLESENSNFIKFKVVPYPSNIETDNIWLKNMVNVELSYLAKIFSLLGGDISGDSIMGESGSIEFRIPIEK